MDWVGRPVGAARWLRGLIGVPLVVAVLVALVLVLVGGAPRATAKLRSRNGDLLLLYPPFGTFIPPVSQSISLLAPHGHHPHTVYTSTSPGGAQFPVFAPSGRQIAFAVDVFKGGQPNSVGYNLMVANADGSGVRQLNPPGQPVPGALLGLAFSPNGQVLAIGEARPGSSETTTQVVFLSVATGAVIRSVTLAAPLYGPVWSPNGELLFQPRLGENGAVDVARADGSHLHRLKIQLPRGLSVVPDADVGEVEVAPSPNGSELAISVVNKDDYNFVSEVYLVRATGGRARRLTRIGTAADPVWSPDGRQIAVANTFRYTTYVVTVATKHATKLPIRCGCVVGWQALPR